MTEAFAFFVFSNIFFRNQRRFSGKTDVLFTYCLQFLVFSNFSLSTHLSIFPYTKRCIDFKTSRM